MNRSTSSEYLKKGRKIQKLSFTRLISFLLLIIFAHQFQLNAMESVITKAQAELLDLKIKRLLNNNENNPNILTSTGIPFLTMTLKGQYSEAPFTRVQIYVIAQLLKIGANPNLIDEQGRTPLSWAVEPSTSKALRGMGTGDLIVTQLLVSAGADINYQDNFGYTPLHLAVKSDPQLTRFLLSQLEINTSLRTSPMLDKKYNPLPNATPLELARFCAANEKNPEIQRFCRINLHWLSVATYNRQWHPIERAAYYGNPDLVYLFLYTGIINTDILKRALLWAQEGLKALQIEAPDSQTGFMGEIYKNQQKNYYKIGRLLLSYLGIYGPGRRVAKTGIVPEGFPLDVTRIIASMAREPLEKI